jgi:hypothetical protein
MSRLIILTSLLVIGTANASTVVTFEEPGVTPNLPLSEGGAFDAEGLHFSGLGVVWRIPYLPNDPIMRIAGSPPTVLQIGIENYGPTVVNRVDGGSFDFLSATFGCACDGAAQVYARGYRNGELTYESTQWYTNYPDPAALLNFNFADIDRLELSRSPGFANGNDALDNLTVNFVPVPPAAFLFPSALGALGWVRRRVAQETRASCS